VRDPVWGITTPAHAFNEDEVPTVLADSHSATVDEKGAEVVWDATSDKGDTARFCTTSLTLGMETHMNDTPRGCRCKTHGPASEAAAAVAAAELDAAEAVWMQPFPSARPHLVSNVIPPLVIFKSTYFTEGEQWKEKNAEGVFERDLWDTRVVVAFQANAWKDTDVQMYYLKKKAIIYNAITAETGLPCVEFADNLGAHKTEPVMRMWTEGDLSTHHARFYPKDMTAKLQVVDRHEGKPYKGAVCKDVAAENVRRYEEATETNTMPVRMSAMEKRIMITHSIGRHHEEACSRNKFFRSFIATGTFVPIDGSRDAEVAPQDLPKYDYHTEVSHLKLEARAAVVLSEAAAAADAKRVADVQLAAERTANVEFRRALDDAALPYLEEAKLIWRSNALPPLLNAKLNETLGFLARKLEVSFVVGGSWPVFVLSQVLLEVGKMNAMPVVFNDIDVYVGSPGEGEFKMLRHLPPMDVPDMVQKANVIECVNLSPASLLDGADLNLIACCLQVTVSGPQVTDVKWKIAPSCWEFLLDSSSKIKARSLATGAQTMIRGSYKAMEIVGQSRQVDLRGLDPSKGVVFASHKAKFDKLTAWEGNPLKGFRLTSTIGKAWKLVEHGVGLACATCGKKGNRTCVGKNCVVCCPGINCKAHKKTSV
jgi:hypothetical protein